ncbi:MAG: carboxypeptidase regulatory-like domain-containing protein [Planctomycetota bacterium]
MVSESRLPVLLFLVAACGGDSSTDMPDRAQPTSRRSPVGGNGGSSVNARAGKSVRKPWRPALGTATIKGVVKFDGTPPDRHRLNMDRDAYCKEHSGGALDSSVIVNANGTLRNAVVWIQKGLDGWEFPVPEEPAVIDQKGCMYVPHVLGIRTGQPLKIRNSDSLMHNIRAVPRRNRLFNFSLSAAGKEMTKRFKKREIAVRLKCDIHDWMGAWVAVVDHPYFQVTGDEGAFELDHVPPGEYTITAWHEVYGKTSMPVTVTGHATETIEFVFSPE